MESIKFKIDPNQYDGIKKKTLKRIAKIGIPSAILPIILIAASGAYDSINDPIPLLIVIGGSLFAIGISFWIGVKQAISNNKSFQIELNAEGAQRLMQGMNFITVPWSQMDTDYSKTGELILVDKKVNKLIRWWNGKGKIPVPNELENDQKFEEIIKRMKKENELQQSI